MNKSLLCVAALFVAVGCNKEKPSDAPAASATAAASAAPAATIDPVASAAPAATDTTAPAATVAAAPVAPAVVAKIPTEEDYEAVAASAITAANASTQLAAIEKEISAK